MSGLLGRECASHCQEAHANPTVVNHHLGYRMFMEASQYTQLGDSSAQERRCISNVQSRQALRLHELVHYYPYGAAVLAKSLFATMGAWLQS